MNKLLPTMVIIQRGFCPILEKFVPLAKLISLRTIPAELSTPKSYQNRWQQAEKKS